MRIRALILGALLTASWSEAARRTAPRPAASELLDLAVTAPAAAAARVRVQVFGPLGSAGRAKAQTRLVLARGPGERRVEVAGKGGSLSLLSVAGGRLLLTAWPKVRRAWLGPAPEPDAAAERKRLDSLYEMSVSTGGRTAKSATWRLDMRSRADGKVRRSLWIARDGGGVLRREDYRPDGTLLRRERTTKRLEPRFTAESFQVRAPEGAEATSSTVPYIAGRSEFPPRFPRWLPDGFVLLQAEGGADRRATVVYSDGLTPVTVVERPAGEGARPASPYARVGLKSGPGALSFDAAGTSLSWTAGDRDYTETGDMPEADLARMADSIGEKP